MSVPGGCLTVRQSHFFLSASTYLYSRDWRQIPRRHRARKVFAFVGSVAKGLICRAPAPTQGHCGASAEPKRLSLLVDNLKIAFHTERSVVKNRHFRRSHKSLPNYSPTPK